MATTSWLIGSRPNLAAQILTLNGGVQLITAGSRYLYASSSALSLVARLKAAMDAVPVAGAAVVLTQSRKVKISAAGVFTLNWTGGEELRDLLGFNGNLAGSASYVATNLSPLLWSPGKTETPEESPLGIVGHRVENAYFSASPFDGSTSVVIHGSRTYNTFTWTHVPMGRVQLADEAGEWTRFWREVVVAGSRFFLWRATEDAAGVSTATTALTQPLGPYVLRAPGRGSPDWDFRRSRGLQLVDRRADISLSVTTLPEY